MPSQLPAGPPIKPPQPIVTQGGRSFWSEAIKIVISFMAVLELLKSGECDARQSDHWGDIDVVALAPAA